MATQWNITVPEETDQLVRDYLAAQSHGEEDLDAFVDHAVRAELLRRTMPELQILSEAPQYDDAQAAVDEMIEWVRDHPGGEKK